MQGDRARSALAGTRFSELRWIAETGSTNDDVLALAREGAPDGLVLVADHQTAGRGRLDRTWESPADASLLLSVLLRPDLAPERAHLLTTAMGVAVAEAVGETLRVFPVIKWPNDLVVLRGDRDDGRKVGGILAESIVTGGRLDAVVVGLGLNVNWPSIPPGLEDIATALNLVVERDVDREDLLVAILRVLDRWTDRLMLPGGREELHVRYHELSGTIGREVRVELSDGAVEGRAIEVTEDGHLVVQPRGTHGHHARQEITVGDVVHLRGA
jgi:BirA family biotin operon repressor/biotin-[acetyl-CoA-carboxylase] ligase